MADKPGIENRSLGDKLASPIAYLGLMTRVSNALRAGGVDRVYQLVRMPHEDVLRFPNIGAKGLDDIRERLKVAGLYLDIDLKSIGFPHQDEPRHSTGAALVATELRHVEQYRQLHERTEEKFMRLMRRQAVEMAQRLLEDHASTHINPGE